MAFSELAAIELDAFDVVSTDVFDTLLLRDLSTQTMRFAEACERVDGPGLRGGGSGGPPQGRLGLRMLLHALAYRAVEVERPQGDVRLADLQSRQSRLMGEGEALASRLVDAELAVERQRLTPNRRLLARLRHFAAAGKRIIAVSDSYYSAVDLERLIAWICGPNPIARIYSSSDLCLTKHSGALFAEVARRERVTTGRILHLGDDCRADLWMARAAGCRAVRLPRPVTVRLARRAAGCFDLGMRWIGQWAGTAAP